VTLTWSDESADPNVIGYKVYYDQAGKAQLVADVVEPTTTTYTDTGLTNGQEYCYKVTSYYEACESGFSNILCATPNGPGQTATAGVSTMETGRYETTGKGKNQVTTFVLTTDFNAGDEVVIRAYVVDEHVNPVPDAVVDIAITGPGSTNLQTEPSDGAGMAETKWQTKKKGGNPTPTGNYTATTTDVTAVGYAWDGVMTSTTFTLNP
jgi:hypothetical protein